MEWYTYGAMVLHLISVYGTIRLIMDRIYGIKDGWYSIAWNLMPVPIYGRVLNWW